MNLLLVGILKHDWPTNWPSFIPDIVAASKCVRPGAMHGQTPERSIELMRLMRCMGRAEQMRCVDRQTPERQMRCEDRQTPERGRCDTWARAVALPFTDPTPPMWCKFTPACFQRLAARPQSFPTHS
jgi:hypothetical protein